MTHQPTRRVIALIDTDNNRWKKVGDDRYAMNDALALVPRSRAWIDKTYGIIGMIVEDEA